MISAFDSKIQNLRAGDGFRSLVLAGNPNVGKSALFNVLTGASTEISNYPGTTIDIAKGKLGQVELADTPGIYGVSSFNDEERIARQMILAAEGVINVVSASSLERDLFLTLQLIDMGKPLMIVVNQWDEAAAAGLKIDLRKLEEELGVPVLPTVAVARKGVSEINRCLPSICKGKTDPFIAELLDGCLKEGDFSSQWQALCLLALEGDKPAAELLPFAIPGTRADIYEHRRKRVNQLVEAAVVRNNRTFSISAGLGKLAIHPLWGGCIALAVCYLIFYQLLGIFVAGTIVDFSEKKIMRRYYVPAVERMLAEFAPVSVTVRDQAFFFPAGMGGNKVESARCDALRATQLPDNCQFNFWYYHDALAVAANTLAGQYGVLTLTATYLLGLLFPLVLGFYLGLSLLEDSGYLPRLAVLVDRYFNKLGLTGRAVIPLILGLGCVTMSMVTTRLLTTNREKIIATALLGIAIPCSAQLGVVSGVLAKCDGMVPWLVYVSIVVGILALAGCLLNKILPGQSGALIIDLPPMRVPMAENVFRKTWGRSWRFMIESFPMFVLAGLLVSVAQMTGLLDWIVQGLHSFTVGWLKLPDDPRVATTFILGIVRRDFAAFGLTDVALTSAQSVVSMVVITLFVPCIATVGVMIKERGLAIAMAIWGASWLLAFGFGSLLARILPPFFQVMGV